jgi:putative ATP-binding cassette transporter
MNLYQPETFDLKTLSRFFAIVKKLALSQIGQRLWFFVALLIFMSLSVNGLNVLNSYVGRDFMTEIEHRNTAGFIHQALIYILVFGISTLFAVYYRYIEERLGLGLRVQMTQKMLDLYMTHPTYYRLCDGSSLTGRVEYTDQRIAEDIKTFSLNTLTILLMSMNGIFTVIAFSGVMWSISPLLFAISILYAVGGSYLTTRLGHPLIGLNYTQFDREAHFRSDLNHVRENAESIAVLRREERVKSRLLKHFDELVENFRKMIEVNRNLGFFTTSYNYLLQIIPALIVAPLFIRGDVEFGVITQSMMAFTMLMGAFSLIINQFQWISSFAAVVARIGTLIESMDKAEREGLCSIEVKEDTSFVRYEQVTLPSTNNAHILVEDLNLEVPKGLRLLITGPDAMANSALFRFTAGVVDVGVGCLHRPPLKEIMFLPERPYLPHATLRELLLHTGEETKTPEREILNILNKLKLTNLVEHIGGLDTETHWWKLLSLGDQQLLAFARVWLAKPDFLVLDRPHSSLDSETIALLLKLLADREITYINFGDPNEPLEFYDAVLTIHPKGRWTFKKIFKP